MAQKPEIYQKVLRLIDTNLTKDELLEFHRALDADSEDKFFWALSSLAAKRKPDAFVSVVEPKRLETDTSKTPVSSRRRR